MNGFICMATFSVSYDFAATVGKPIDEGLSLGFLNLIAQTFGFFTILGLSDLLKRFDEAGDAPIDKEHAYLSGLILSIFIFASIISLFFVKNNPEEAES